MDGRDQPDARRNRCVVGRHSKAIEAGCFDLFTGTPPSLRDKEMIDPERFGALHRRR